MSIVKRPDRGLSRRHGRLFTNRELNQGRHLRKALRRLMKRNQCGNPLGRTESAKRRYGREMLQPVKPTAMSALNAHNGSARSYWFRLVASRLCRHLKATAPGWTTTSDVFLLSIVDKEDVVRDGDGQDFEVTSEMLGKIRTKFFRLLPGLDYLGMIDVALHVSTSKVMGVPRFITPHCHLLVWGTSEKRLKKACDKINLQIRPVLPYSSAADYQRVTDGDLLQVLWYINKMPRSQYQLWLRRKGYSLKQYTRKINGTNAVRLYSAMPHITIPELAVAGGEGVKIRAKLFRDVGDEG